MLSAVRQTEEPRVQPKDKEDVDDSRYGLLLGLMSLLNM